MCSIAGAGLVLSAFGTLSAFAGQRQQAQATQASATFNAQVAANNATIARQQAGQAHDIGKVNLAKQQLEARKLIGLQRAALAGGGVLVGQGSAADITAGTRAQAGVDAATIRSNTAREALGFLAQGANFDAQGGLILAEGSNRASAINSESFSTLLTGAGSVATKWNAYRDTGVKPFGAF